MPSAKASEATTGPSSWLGAKASMHFSVDLELSSRVWFHQLVVSVGAYLASALGITAVRVLFFVQKSNVDHYLFDRALLCYVSRRFSLRHVQHLPSLNLRRRRDARGRNL